MPKVINYDTNVANCHLVIGKELTGDIDETLKTKAQPTKTCEYRDMRASVGISRRGTLFFGVPRYQDLLKIITMRGYWLSLYPGALT